MPVQITPRSIIAIFVMLVIGASLISPLADIMYSVTNVVGIWALNGSTNATIGANENLTGAPTVLLGLIVLFFAIMLLIIAVKHIRN